MGGQVASSIELLDEELVEDLGVQDGADVKFLDVVETVLAMQVVSLHQRDDVVSVCVRGHHHYHLL
jgi:hypothetical protein